MTPRDHVRLALRVQMGVAVQRLIAAWERLEREDVAAQDLRALARAIDDAARLAEASEAAARLAVTPGGEA